MSASHKILVVHGPNLDRLGTREPEIYGRETLSELNGRIQAEGLRLGATTECRQSNHEGDLVTWIGASRDEGFAGLLVNAGALTHTSVGVLDAIRAASVPCVEVHLSHPEAREAFREKSVMAAGCIGKVTGFGGGSYLLALAGLLEHLRRPRA